jgi:hypothetical protein
MRVRFERSGGFAGTKLACDVDDACLTPAERQELCDLVGQADFFALPASLGGEARGADRFTYRVSVEDGARSRTVTAREEALPEGLVDLVEWLAERARHG